MTRRQTSLLLPATCLFGCRPQTPPATEEVSGVDSDRAAIEALRERELAAMNSGDAQGFVDIAADDVVFDASGHPAAVGKEAIMTLCEALFERTIYEATYPADELVIDHDWAFDRGVWFESQTSRQSGAQIQVSFGMLQVYRRQADGSWKLARSIWNRK